MVSVSTADEKANLALQDENWVSLVSDILANKRYLQLCHCKHHRGMSRIDHCIHVSYSCYLFCVHWHLRCIRDAVRGALLHDFFLYNYAEERALTKHRLHAWFHPRVACNNAMEEFSLTKTEKMVILRHMFPATIVPPTKVASWLVVIFDKVWAIREYAKKG